MPTRENSQVKAKAKKIRQLDFSKSQNCKELEKIVNKKYKYCPTQQFDGKFNIIDQIINRSEVLQSYMSGDIYNEMGNPNEYQLTNMSIMSQIGRVANRQCYEPKIKIDGELVFQFQNPNSNRIKKDYTNVFYCSKSGPFLLSMQAEPNYSLIYTLNGKNPLLAPPNQKIFISQSYLQSLQPPITISVVAINNEFCLPSKVLTIIVKKHEANGRDQKAKKQTGMIRPQFYIDMDSRSNYSQIIQI